MTAARIRKYEFQTDPGPALWRPTKTQRGVNDAHRKSRYRKLFYRKPQRRTVRSNAVHLTENAVAFRDRGRMSTVLRGHLSGMPTRPGGGLDKEFRNRNRVGGL